MEMSISMNSACSVIFTAAIKHLRSDGGKNERILPAGASADFR